MLLLSSSVDSLRTTVGSFWANQSATLLSDAIMAACSVLRSLPPAPPLPTPLFLERGLWWSAVNFDTWSLMVTFPGEVLSNSMVKEAWPWAAEQTCTLTCKIKICRNPWNSWNYYQEWHFSWLACRCVSNIGISVLGGNLMDAIVGHVTLLCWNLKVIGTLRWGCMKNIFFTFVPATRLFTVCVGKARKLRYS